MISPARASLAILALVVGGCAAPSGGAERSTPPTCTLTPEELKSRRAQLVPGLLARADEVTDIEDGLRMRFVSRPGLLDELIRAIEQERTCCSFLRFTLTAPPSNGDVIFEVTGPPGTREMLRSL